MSIFLSNPKYGAEFTNTKIIQNDQIIKDIPLIKNGEFSYSSDQFVVPSGEFKIFIEGWDSNGNPIIREFTVDVSPKPIPKNVEKIEIPDGVTQVIFTAKKGKKQSLKVYDSFGKEYVDTALGDDSELIVVENPSVGTWTVHSEDGFSYSFRNEPLVAKFVYGFSLAIPNSKEDTAHKPIKGKVPSFFYKIMSNNPLILGSKNVLSVFVSNPKYAGKLKILKVNVGGKRRYLLLKKIRDDLYVTNPMSFDEAPSNVGVIGMDPDQERFDENIPSVLETDEGKMKFSFVGKKGS